MRTLVLNKNWMPIKHIDWRRAIILVIRESAEILEIYDDHIKTPNDIYFKPAVIRLIRFGGVPRVKVCYSRRAVLERDKYTCQYCGCKLSHGSATIDHINPRSRGGTTTFDNTVACCFDCNNRKGAKPLRETSLKLSKKPVKPAKLNFSFKMPKEIKSIWRDYLPRGMLNGIQIID